MTSWRSRFGGWAGRYSPAAPPQGPPPQVSDSDFTYLTAEDIVEPPRRVYDPYQSNYPRHGNVTRPHDPNLGPDILLLKHKSITYPLHFPAYSIPDGELTVGDVREEAARQTTTEDRRRITLLYKGRILKDDSKPCKAEGLKQQSELLCVVSEVIPTDGGMDEDSESGADSPNGPTVEVDGTISAPAKKRRNHRGKKKGRQGGSGTTSPRNENLAPPESTAGFASTATSRPTTPAQPKTVIEKLEEIASTFHTKFVPQCVQYLANPPHDAKTRDLEYKKLSETILAQVILKLDAVETEGDMEAKQKRRDLVKETQAMLGRLDVAHANGS
ncbi:hypothetical protein MMC16_004231 [Acarospora aff. strigata]|nr:hypothetical protein [Acarospora aff. strigata]